MVTKILLMNLEGVSLQISSWDSIGEFITWVVCNVIKL